MRPVRVYTASKLDKADLWKKLREEYRRIEFTARWVDSYVPNEQEHECSPHFLAVAWKQNLEDVARADAVLVYGDESGALRGALVEAGVGLALGKTVILVGDAHCYGTWQYHINCVKVPTVAHAVTYLMDMERRVS